LIGSVEGDARNADLRLLWARELSRSGRKNEAIEQSMLILREQAHAVAARDVVTGLLEKGQAGAIEIARLADEWLTPEDASSPAGGPPPFPGSRGGPDACRVLVQALLEDPARLRAVLDAVTASGENGAAGSKPVLTILKPATLVLLAEAATRFRSFAQARSLYE
jgi:hypothetical protein